ncbi:hypothetical protein ACNQF7_10280 [Flavobacterium sp. RSP29]|uniref:hypothetical protein n=1 Tax=Flavobacterium sp. RSP29 TaxID=3401731 RepID=UPI003AAAB9CD
MYLKKQFSKARLDTQFDSGIKFELECEKIADKHAVDFARYVANNPKIFNSGISMEMALGTFKAENNFRRL